MLFRILSTFVILSLYDKGGEACSCFPAHPQTHYCKSDYVLLVNVRGTKFVSRERSQVYQVKVRRAFKMNEKTSLTLKNGQIWSPKDEAGCGIQLKNNTKYLIAGRVDGGKAWLTLCNYHEEWSKLTTKQRKGFRLLYKQGCECKIATCLGRRWKPTCPVNANTCAWDSLRSSYGDCQGQYSICMPQPNGHCQWNKSRAFRECMKENDKKKRERQRLEP